MAAKPMRVSVEVKSESGEADGRREPTSPAPPVPRALRWPRRPSGFPSDTAAAASEALPAERPRGQVRPQVSRPQAHLRAPLGTGGPGEAVPHRSLGARSGHPEGRQWGPVGVQVERLFLGGGGENILRDAGRVGV